MFEELKKLFITVIGNRKELDNMTEDSLLFDDLKLDSISMLYMVIAIEEKYKVCMTNQSIADFKSVRDVENYILTNKNSK